MQNKRHKGDDSGCILEPFAGCGGATLGFLFSGSNVIACENNQQQMGWLQERLERWPREVKNLLTAPITVPMQGMLVHKDDCIDYDPTNVDTRYLVKPQCWDPVPIEAMKDWERIYGGAKALLVRNIIFFFMFRLT